MTWAWVGAAFVSVNVLAIRLLREWRPARRVRSLDGVRVGAHPSGLTMQLFEPRWWDLRRRWDYARSDLPKGRVRYPAHYTDGSTREVVVRTWVLPLPASPYRAVVHEMRPRLAQAEDYGESPDRARALARVLSNHIK